VAVSTSLAQGQELPQLRHYIPSIVPSFE